MQINVDRVRENLSRGLTWKRRIAVTEVQAIQQLAEIGFRRRKDGRTFLASRSDLPALRPGELMSVSEVE